MDQPDYNNGGYAAWLPVDHALYHNPMPWSDWHSEHVGSNSNALGGYDHLAYEAMRIFFERASSHQIDPTSYAEIDHSLVPLRNFTTTPNGSLTSTERYTPSHAPAEAIRAGLSLATFPLLTGQDCQPHMPHVRSQRDLEAFDGFLGRMQDTAYENATHVTAGVQIRTCIENNPSVPPHSQASKTQRLSRVLPGVVRLKPMTAASMPSPASSTSYSLHNSSSTSAALCLTSQSHDNTAISSQTYPQLPNVLPTVTQAIGQSVSATLGPGTSSNERERYHGSTLQAARGTQSFKLAGHHRETASRSANSASRLGSPLSESDSDPIGGYDACCSRWLVNMRAIEFLRAYIRRYLESTEYPAEAADNAAQPQFSSRLYPQLAALRS